LRETNWGSGSRRDRSRFKDITMDRVHISISFSSTAEDSKARRRGLALLMHRRRGSSIVKDILDGGFRYPALFNKAATHRGDQLHSEAMESGNTARLMDGDGSSSEFFSRIILELGVFKMLGILRVKIMIDLNMA
jgi:hypothetical protein